VERGVRLVGRPEEQHPAVEVVQAGERRPLAEAGVERVVVGDELGLGEGSPFARLYDLDGRVLFLGTTHETNTSLHLAEYRTENDPGRVSRGASVLEAGEGRWVTYEDVPIENDDFPECGAAFEAHEPEAVRTGTVGAGAAKLLEIRPMVDFAVDWFDANRDWDD
jgi:aminoglycoside 3-N-acetyltransferase